MNMDIIINNFTMPDCCAGCPFEDKTEGYCLADRERRNTNDDPCERAWWCPLEYAMIVDTF